MNAARGECVVELGGVSNVHRTTLGSIARIEGRLGKPIAEVVGDLGRGSYATCLAILEETLDNRPDAVPPADLSDNPKALVDACVQILAAGGLMGKPKAGKATAKA